MVLIDCKKLDMTLILLNVKMFCCWRLEFQYILTASVFTRPEIGKLMWKICLRQHCSPTQNNSYQTKPLKHIFRQNRRWKRKNKAKTMTNTNTMTIAKTMTMANLELCAVENRARLLHLVANWIDRLDWIGVGKTEKKKKKKLIWE